MTPKQTQLYWREWAAVRRMNPDADRKALHLQALGVEKSSKQFDNRDLDKVLAVFRGISDPGNLGAQLRAQEGSRARLEHRLSEMMQMLGLYVEDPAGYVAKLVTDRWGVPTGGTMGPDDLSDQPTVRTDRQSGELKEGPSQLHQLVITLWGRLRAMARAEDHSVADMYALSGIRRRRTRGNDGRSTGFGRNARKLPARTRPAVAPRKETPVAVPVGAEEEPF